VARERRSQSKLPLHRKAGSIRSPHERKPAPTDEGDFKIGMAPLLEANRLGALLLQFPGPSRIRPKNRAYLVSLHKRFAEYPLVVEVRHASWIEDNVLGLFAELGVGICNIDQPLFHRSVKPDAHVTAAIGYVRLHGRNYRNWFSKIADVRERYDHLYSLDELAPWVDRTKEIALHAKDTYVLSKNHNIGKAAVNSLDIRAIFTGQPVKVPPSLILAYPHLEVVAE
jgi:uncharacterized protein YecE (DUF72 family)